MLELAREQVDQLGRSHVSPDHLLLGILEEDEETPEQYRGIAIRILNDTFGLDLTQLEQRLREK